MHKRRTKKENATKCRKKVESSETTSKYVIMASLANPLLLPTGNNNKSKSSV